MNFPDGLLEIANSRAFFVGFWLGTVPTAPDKQRLLLPQQPTFQPAGPHSRRVRPLHPQQQTFLVVSPKVRS